MNKSIRFTSLAAMVMVVILLLNLTWVQAFSQDKYAHNPLNKRQFFELKSIPRGQISAGGLILAKSTKGESGFYTREYPSSTPEAYGPVEGYLSDMYGAAGLEEGYNAILNGTDPSLFARRTWDTITGHTHRGASLKLTLIPQVQELAYHELADHGYDGAVVAIRPSTGEILAMAQTPSFNPESIVNPATAQNAWQQLTSNPAAPLLNHATQEPLPPGSIFKIVTTTAGLSHGFTPQTLLTGAPRITLPGTNTTLENYGGETCGGGGQVPLTTAFALSCNTAFVQMGVKVGADALNDAAASYGFGETYDLGIPEEAAHIGDLSDDAARGISSIGQRDVALTALDAAVMAATVANKGVRMKPYLVSEVVDTNLKPLNVHKPEKARRGVDPGIAAQLTDLMRRSERDTFGYQGADIASKTGTAEHGEHSRSSLPHTWYVAFGPSENADVAVAVVVKNGGGHGAGATGGSVSSPIGRKVIDAVLKAGRQ